MPSADTPIHPEENPSTTASPRFSMIRVPRRLLWFSAAVLTWFLVSEGATEAWYRWKEKSAEPTEPWGFAVFFQTGGTNPPAAFTPGELTEREKELLHFTSGRKASWRDPKGNQWSGFHLEWEPNKLLNQMDVTHNPTVCLPAAGLELVQRLPDVVIDQREVPIRFKAWEFAIQGRPVFVYVASRWDRQYEQVEYRKGALAKRLANLWKAVEGIRGNVLETVEFVLVGPRHVEEAESAFRKQLDRLIAVNQSGRERFSE